MDSTGPPPRRRLFDIASYLTTPTYKGVYDGIKEHEPDLTGVLNRAWRRGIERIVIPGINANVSREALVIARMDERLWTTVGCSPARSHEFDKEGPDEYLSSLASIVETNRDKVLAFGEIGLDYRWLEICDRDTQHKYFELQVELAKSLKLPIFINTRNSVEDVVKVLQRANHTFGGVIHSFDGTWTEAQRFIDMGYYIGINGCSLRTDENLEMVRALPLERMLLESNSPWCLLKPLHAGYRFVKSTYPARAKFHWSPDSMVRGRNEPSNVNQVAEVVAAIKEEEPETIADITYKNTEQVFFANNASVSNPST